MRDGDGDGEQELLLLIDPKAIVILTQALLIPVYNILRLTQTEQSQNGDPQWRQQFNVVMIILTCPHCRIPSDP